MIYVAEQHPLYSIFKEIYAKQAVATLAGSVDDILKLHAPNFFSVPLNGKKASEANWAASVQHDIDAHKYLQVTYEIEKITNNKSVCTVYSTRRCSGINDKNKSFNTEVRLKDDFILANDGAWLMQSSETVSRSLWLDGVRLGLEQIPGVIALEQGCSDHGGPGHDD